MNILLSILIASIVGFILSSYIFSKTQRKSLEHKAMLIFDGLFVVSAVYALVSMMNGSDPVIPKGLVLWILVPIDLYVGIVAIHYRDEQINTIGRTAREEEQQKSCVTRYVE